MFKSLRNKASTLSPLSVGTSRTAPEKPSVSAHSAVLSQVHAFEIALQAMDLLLDDRNLEGTTLLKTEHEKYKKGHTDPAAIFPLALGVMEFIEATLGFETEVMERAGKTLAAAENAALAHAKHNQKHNVATSHIYPPGTEFQVTYAESTLLHALVMLLQENNTMMEQAKALLKLRKAYQILDATYKKIKESEPVFSKNLARFRKQAETHSLSSVDLPGFDLPGPSSTSTSTAASTSSSTSALGPDQELMRNLEKVYQMRKSRIEGTSINASVSASARTVPVNLFRDSASSLGSLGNKDTTATSSGTATRGSATIPQVNVSFMHDNKVEGNQVARSSLREEISSPGTTGASGENDGVDAEEDDEFADASDVLEPSQNSTDWESSLDSHNILSSKINSLSDSMVSLNTSFSSVSTGAGASSNTGAAADSHLHVSTIDEFIHSGVQLCFGILQVVLSLIPPAIGRVLSIVGFKGDRVTGLHMLWRTAITARNIHGDLALLFLLVFYDGPIQFVDTGFQLPGYEDSERSDIIQLKDRSTVSDAELARIIDHPNLYTPQLLKKARLLFPNNCLWLLQEGRMLAADGEIEKALHMMQTFTDDPDCRIEMEQVEAIFTFDRAMFYTFVHDFDSAARDFTRMLDISSWSSSVYLFMAGACYLEKWRSIQAGLLEFSSQEEKKEKLKYYEQKADHYLKLAPTYVPGYGANASKKGGIGGSGKQMPFDKFVLRKTKQIEARKKANPELLYIECVGTSIILEMIYFWNGYTRMPQEKLEQSIRMLDFSAGKHASFTETTDEAMIRNLFQSIALRQTGKVKEGLNLLDTEVISEYVTQDVANAPFKFQKMTYSPYLYPTALHEKASFVWKLQHEKDAKRAVSESSSWLKKAEIVSDVGDYELSNRTSMAIKAASERLEQVKEILDQKK
ncbi:hypothetical protein JCM33374_g5041 [Metschnikowia sp. JCM 33374]|nr:hypothetical protein JCM33374_g5041 [Metschnikowia sp. JCM 33374]